MPISELLYFLRPVYTHSLSSSHLHSFLASLTREMLLSCCSFSFSSVRNKLPIPRCIFAAIILSLHALLLLLVSDLLPLSLPVSCVVGNSEYVFNTLECWQRDVRGGSEIFQEERFHTERVRRELVCCFVMGLYVFLPHLLFFFPKRPIQHCRGQGSRRQTRKKTYSLLVTPVSAQRHALSP